MNDQFNTTASTPTNEEWDLIKKILNDLTNQEFNLVGLKKLRKTIKKLKEEKRMFYLLLVTEKTEAFEKRIFICPNGVQRIKKTF